MYGLLSDRDCPRCLHFNLKTMNKMTQIASTNAPVAPRTIKLTPITKNNENLNIKIMISTQLFRAKISCKFLLTKLKQRHILSISDRVILILVDVFSLSKSNCKNLYKRHKFRIHAYITRKDLGR